jgi:hypothetical protein
MTKGRPRLLLALLLAFLIDATRPVVQPAVHGHADGERPHVHLGEIPNRGAGANGPWRGDVSPATDGRPGIARASSLDLHVHLFRTFTASDVAPTWPTAVLANCLVAPVPDSDRQRPATVRRRPARAPPGLLA